MKHEPSPMFLFDDTVIRLDRIDYVTIDREEDSDNEFGIFVGVIDKDVENELTRYFKTKAEQRNQASNLISAWKAWILRRAERK